MSDYGWIKEVTAAGAIIFFCYLLLRAIIGRADKLTNATLNRSTEDSKTIKEMSDDIALVCNDMSTTLRDIEQSMVNRDQIILNHMEHFEDAIKGVAETQFAISNILASVCDKLDINGDYQRGEP